jgi:hypothetical protein
VALTDDQRAMLRLLAQREQGYEDLAALMGLSVEEVRVKVREALAEIDQSGQTLAEATEEPEAKAEVPEPPPAPAATEPQAEKPAERAPVEPPVTPKPPPPPPSKPSAPAPSRRPSIRLPEDQRLLAGGLAGAVAVILILVLALSGGGGSSSSSPTTTTTATTPTGNANTTAPNPKLTEAVLSPVNGSNASGRALFGRIRKTPVLQVEARGLQPSPKGQSYTVWLYRSPKLVLRVGAGNLGKSGGVTAHFPIPTQLLAYVAGGAFDQIDISLTQDAAYEAEVAKAKKEKRLPEYTGTDILRGKITGPAIKK